VETKAIRLPSGDHAGLKYIADGSPERLTCPVPSGFIT
jgi:hypothetical protein